MGLIEYFDMIFIDFVKYWELEMLTIYMVNPFLFLLKHSRTGKEYCNSVGKIKIK